MSADVYKFIFAAGGTGGHLYPAIAVAEQLKILSPKSKILFIGTKNKIESKVVPQLGFSFKTIWISGFARKVTIKNLLFPLKVIVSLIQSLILNINFKPNVVIGAGAYVSGPIAWVASYLGSKIVLLEQNSFPGVTNRMLEKKADSIHISFKDSQKYFKNVNKLNLTGNPIRNTVKLKNRTNALKEFSFETEKKTLLILGGSLGAGSINIAIKENLEKIISSKIQIIWQTGASYFENYKNLESKNVRMFPFLTDMGNAYSACDLILARAGATTIAEAANLGLPVIFVPSKNVAANHQYMNAKSLVDNNAGLLIEDDELLNQLSSVVVKTINDKNQLEKMSKNIKKYSKPEAAYDIAIDVLRLAENRIKN